MASKTKSTVLGESDKYGIADISTAFVSDGRITTKRFWTCLDDSGSAAAILMAPETIPGHIEYERRGRHKDIWVLKVPQTPLSAACKSGPSELYQSATGCAVAPQAIVVVGEFFVG
jgi:hypothetical protein